MIVIREKIVDSGKYREVLIYPFFGDHKKKRSAKKQASTQRQVRANHVTAQKKLARILNANFKPGDVRVELTYKDEFYPTSIEDSQRKMKNFLRRMKSFRRKAGRSELKYVFVTEIGRTFGRIHHHVVMSGNISKEEVHKIWGQGSVRIDKLKFGPTGLVDLAYYLTKDPIMKKHWIGSRNLNKPIQTVHDDRISQRDLNRWTCLGWDERQQLTMRYGDGYVMSLYEHHFNELTGNNLNLVFFMNKNKK